MRTDDRPRLLLVGGGGGLIGRSTLTFLASSYRVRSIHRHPVPSEKSAGVEWIPADIGNFTQWASALREVDVVVNLAWYRWGRRGQFAALCDGLLRMLEAAQESRVRRIVQVSVPEAPPGLEADLPYLAYKRRFDEAVRRSGVSYAIVRPTMLFGPGDRLLTVMLRLMHRYHRFPLFGTGAYHVSPVSVTDVAEILLDQTRSDSSGTFDIGGPHRYAYVELTDRMFDSLGLRPRYVRLTPRTSMAVARLLQSVGSSLLYAYEVEWLLSDRLGIPPYGGLDHPLEPVEPFLARESQRLRNPARG